MDQTPPRHASGIELPQAIGREDYRRWAARQPRGRFERIGGRVVQVSPERIVHAQVKMRVWQALDRAVREAEVPCQALGDGVTVEVDDDTDYEPDALVNEGPLPDLDAVVAPNPVIVVEVVSPSSRASDTGAKLAGYFRVPSIQHYLVVCTTPREVIHHARRGDAIETRVLRDGTLRLDPPGIGVAVAEFYRDLPALDAG